MERTFPQKVKPVPSCAIEDGVMVSQSRQALPEVNRRVRTSAAMIGLAISVGAYSLPLPNQGDEAIAAEPVAGESNATVLPSEFDVAAVSPRTETTNLTPATSTSEVVEHTVQEGQTLWQLAQFYRVNASDVASANGISVNAVLHVGQVLKIPTNSQSASVTSAASSVSNAPEYYGPIESVAVAASDRDAALKAQQNAALETLKQKQESLRLSLAKLEPANGSKAPVATQGISEGVPSIAEASYQVVSGDTLGAIAKAHKISLKQLVEANRLVNPNVLNVNQALVIPQVDAAETLTAASLKLTVDAPVIVASSNPDQLPLPKAVQRQQAVDAQPEARVAKTLPLLTRSSTDQTVADQTVPSVSLNHSATLPTAIGGNTEVATAAFVGGQPIRSDRANAGESSNYVESLRLEIVKLREKYQGSANQVQPTTSLGTKVAAASLNVTAPMNAESSSTAINPEFKPTRYTQALQEQIRKLQASQQQSKKAELKDASADLAPVSTQAQPQLVATASIGSQSYEPLIPSSVGQMVSPDLPPLGSIDAYLPGNSGKFNGYIWPAKGVLTSGFGYRWGRLHKGIDIAAPVGTPVVAAASGVIVSAGWNSGGYGNMVEIQHPDGSVTLYAHNSRILVREGQEVVQGQQIADMGSTGYSTGPHSHFEVHLPGQGAVNPMAHLPRAQA